MCKLFRKITFHVRLNGVACSGLICKNKELGTFVVGCHARGGEAQNHSTGSSCRGWVAYFGISQYYRPLPTSTVADLMGAN